MHLGGWGLQNAIQIVLLLVFHITNNVSLGKGQKFRVEEKKGGILEAQQTWAFAQDIMEKGEREREGRLSETTYYCINIIKQNKYVHN